MARIPVLPGLRSLVPRASFMARPILPLTSRIPIQRPQFLAFSRLSSWRTFSSSPLRSSPPSPSSPNPSDHDRAGYTVQGPGADATLSQRLKHLIKTYGWYALGIYLIIGVLDFGVAFAAINVIGADQVSRATDAVKQRVDAIVHSTPLEPGKPEYEYESSNLNPNRNASGKGGRESLYAMLVLAYTVHKTLFVPFRVGLTAAFTPRLVGWLGRRGYAGGAGTKRAAREMRDRMRRDRD